MKINQPGIYHIYNRGNNKQKIFFDDGNYDYFLNKCNSYLKPVCEILAYCLMFNHFHFQIEATEKSLEPVKCGNLIMPAISNGFRLLQSSYAKGINASQNRTGSLFQQKTKSKLAEGEDYALTAFQYIHQNPVKAGLVKYPWDWKFSSCNEFLNPVTDGICNIERAKELLGLNGTDLRRYFLKDYDEDYVGGIF